MAPRTTIRSLPKGFEIIKDMGFSLEWESDYRQRAREALKEIRKTV